MKRIVIPTQDFENTQFTFKYASMLFGLSDVQYTLLNTYEEPHKTAGNLINLTDWLAEESQRVLKLQLEGVLKETPDAEGVIQTASHYGDLATVLNGMHKHNPIDFVVMGTSGADGLKRFFGGSNTSNVVASVSCPVISLPYDDSLLMPINRVCVALDYQSTPDNFFLDQVKYVAELRKAEVQFVYVETELEDKRKAETVAQINEYIQGHLGNLKHSFHEHKANSISEGLSQFVETNGSNILAMMGRKHGFLERLFVKSNTKEMSCLSAVPVLVTHE